VSFCEVEKGHEEILFSSFFFLILSLLLAFVGEAVLMGAEEVFFVFKGSTPKGMVEKVPEELEVVVVREDPQRSQLH